MADVARSTRTKLICSWTQSDRSSDANQRGSTGTPTWIRWTRLSISAPDGLGADAVADTLAEAAGMASWNEGLVGVAAQAPTEIATKAATLAPTTTDEYRIELHLGLGCHGERPKFAAKGSIFQVHRHWSTTPQRRRENGHSWPSSTSVAARRIRTEARAITIAVPAPQEPGSYWLDVDMLDLGGRPLPAADVVDIPSVEVQVWSDRAVRYDLAPSLDGTGVVVRVTNTGLVTIPAVQDMNRSVSRDPDARMVRSVVTLTASTTDPRNPLPVRLLETPLVTDLLPGASVSFDVRGIAARTGRATNWLSANLSVLGDATWLEVQSPADAWFCGAEKDGGPSGAR